MKLQDWMNQRDLTDAAMADRMGGCVSRSQINRIRRGKSSPSKVLARELEQVTNIPAGNFVMGDAGLEAAT